MEKVEGLMRNLKLSAAEQQGFRIGGKDVDMGKGVELKAIGKVLSEKPVYAEGLAQSLGKVWSPLKEVRCKDMGGNKFMFTFMYESGKRKALYDGPWMVNNTDLIVMVEFDPEKSLEEYVFDTIPIWIRVMKLPLGWMNRDTGLELGDMVGEGIDVEVGEDGSAAGEFLRIKVRIKITEPLMRGITINLGENRTKWCPFEYEYLPEFCYTCGVLGHDDKSCSIKLKKGEKQQFGGWLRAYIPKKGTGGDKQRWLEGRSWSGGHGYGFGGRGAKGRSESLTWRKDGGSGATKNNTQRNSEVSEESADVREKEKEQAQQEKDDPLDSNGIAKADLATHESLGHKASMSGSQLVLHGSSHVERLSTQEGDQVDRKEGRQGNEKGNGKFRRKQRKEDVSTNQEKLNVRVGRKREGDPMEVEENEGGSAKKVKGVMGGEGTILAGLSEQPCKDQ
ncbi:hypothetical protein QYE76_003237 [Lolium multiflorum]|uniref:Zinc knuckle CX2CX4HX4C domain-containing protein n=1 Tax=Lolium multiflorum TaxID=4521 RepID=A0AAD8VZ21_LOLMU|nr:hypothetical protein QYE76_003237 [Lolium multiflorum]